MVAHRSIPGFFLNVKNNSVKRHFLATWVPEIYATGNEQFCVFFSCIHVNMQSVI